MCPTEDFLSLDVSLSLSPTPKSVDSLFPIYSQTNSYSLNSARDSFYTIPLQKFLGH